MPQLTERKAGSVYLLGSQVWWSRRCGLRDCTAIMPTTERGPNQQSEVVLDTGRVLLVTCLDNAGHLLWVTLVKWLKHDKMGSPSHS